VVSVVFGQPVRCDGFHHLIIAQPGSSRLGSFPS
jgi:hypothetical protein